MSDDKSLKRITEKYKSGKLGIREDLPDDLKIAIETFIQQVVVMEEYDLDYVNSEYVINLLETFSKYPEYSITTLDMVEGIMSEMK